MTWSWCCSLGNFGGINIHLSPIQFHHHSLGCGIHHCYHSLNEQFPNGLAGRAPSGVRYSPRFVLLLFAEAWVVLLEPRSHPAVLLGPRRCLVRQVRLGVPRFVWLHFQSWSNSAVYDIVHTRVHIQVANSRPWLTGCRGIWYKVASMPALITYSSCWPTAWICPWLGIHPGILDYQRLAKTEGWFLGEKKLVQHISSLVRRSSLYEFLVFDRMR